MGTGGYLAVIIVGSWFGYIVSAYLSDIIGQRKNFFIFAIGSLLIAIAYTQTEISDRLMLRTWISSRLLRLRNLQRHGTRAYRTVSD